MRFHVEIGSVVAWLNANEGLLALILFSVSAAYAWFSGIIGNLRRRPKLNIDFIEGPTLCAIDNIGQDELGRETHRVSISLYLKISNSGSAPTSIGDIRVGYKWSLPRFSAHWWVRLFSNQWIENQTISLKDFQAIVSDDGDVKLFPFLTQKSTISGSSANSYLEIGEITNGVVYFEQPDAWGACQPLTVRGKTKISVQIKDAFGGRHRASRTIPVVPVAEAKKFNPSFGESLNRLKAIPKED